MLNFCPKCGKKLENDKKSCLECGADLSEREEFIENINVSYGDFPQRIFAWVIDINIIFFTSFLTAIFTSGENVLFMLNAYLFIFGFCYFWLLESFNKGKTVGKLLLKLKTVDDKTFKKASPAKYAINSIFKSTPFIVIDLILGYFTNMRSEANKKQFRFTQTLSETTVISTKIKEEE